MKISDKMFTFSYKKAFFFFIVIITIAWVAGAILNMDSVKILKINTDAIVGNKENVVDIPKNKNKNSVAKNSECVPAGCSKELCVESDIAKDISSICVYKEVYSCYRKANCGRRSNGKCGWSETPELIDCVGKFE